MFVFECAKKFLDGGAVMADASALGRSTNLYGGGDSRVSLEKLLCLVKAGNSLLRVKVQRQIAMQDEQAWESFRVFKGAMILKRKSELQLRRLELENGAEERPVGTKMPNFIESRVTFRGVLKGYILSLIHI